MVNPEIKNIKDSEVRERILETARSLFIQHGYKSTSIRNIAAASDTNVAMVNYYFNSKYNLFELIFEDALDMMTQRIFSTVTSDLPFFELIRSWIYTYYEILSEYPQIPIFILNEVRLNPEKLTSRIKKREPYGIYEKIAERIDREVKKGTIKEIPFADFLLNVLSLCMFPFMFGNLAITLMNISSEKYQELLKEHKEYVVEFVINAIQK